MPCYHLRSNQRLRADVVVDALETVLHHGHRDTFLDLLTSGVLYEHEIADTILVGEHHEALFKGAVDAQLVVLHKTYHTVGHDEVGIITPACRELVTEGLFIGHKFHGAFHTIVV